MINPELEAVEPSDPKPNVRRKGYRILCIGETWRGSDAQAAFGAFDRLGHEVRIIDEWHFVPMRWQSLPLKALRKGMSPMLVRELARSSIRTLREFRPHLLFVFKGRWVARDIIESAHAAGIATANFYPDVSFTVHGRYLPKTLPVYDHIFNTKSYGIADMKRRLGVENVSLLAPGFDPTLHRPLELAQDEREIYGCDVAFVGTWSPKKEQLLSDLISRVPRLSLRIWGCQWEKRIATNLDRSVMGREVTGDDYVKAICGAKIALGLLSEIRSGASSGDLITARTFQIPACGTFMVHERNAEVAEYFRDEAEVAFFSGAAELAIEVERYLSDDDARTRMSRAALERSFKDGNAIDSRLSSVISWLDQQQSVSLERS